MARGERRAAPLRGFPPVSRADARVLVLGSMPGEASLRRGEYYAHRGNGFWPIVAGLLGLPPGATYAARVRALRGARIALWDVLRSCRREGSADAAIRDAMVNDFPAFFARHPRITHVFFNGAAAERWFLAHAAPALAGRPLRYARLPSTSPAHASLDLARKRAAWRVILAPARAGGKRT